MILGDLGANVIKVERPGTGDDTRSWGPPWAVAGATRESVYYLSINRNKRSITADLSAKEGRERVRALALGADVLVENFAPGSMERWGLGYETIAAGNPGLVFCSITGHGSSGREAGRPGYDFTVQARAGWMSVTGEVDGDPMKVGFALVDVLTGQNAATAILAALRERDASGAGQRVEVSLFDSALAGLINVAQAALVTDREPGRYGNAHPAIVPYQTFHAADRPFALAVGNDRQWARLCALLELDAAAADPRFATNPARVENRAEVVRLLAARFRSRTAGEWLEALDGAGIPCAPVQGVLDALSEPLARDTGGIWAMDGSTFGRVETVASPLRLRKTPPALRRPAPALGEHDEEIDRHGWGLRIGS
jgi:crotonobetainyl-CoA:carnitine CoA-transferase CaiB-like acyl-CoA transferase